MNYNNDDNEFMNEETSNDEKSVNHKSTTKQENNDNKILNKITAIIYPTIFTIILTIMFFSLWGLEDTIYTIRYIIGLMLYVLCAFTILQTDIYLLVIPLPIIFSIM